jgi:ribonucleotide reductase alpha subunit
MEELFVRETAVSSGKKLNEQGSAGNQEPVENSEEVSAEKMENGKKVYSHEEAYEASIKYFKGDELAARVWANKYALKDSFGNIYEKTPDDMHRRLASEIHRIELKYKNPLPEELIFDRFQIHRSPGQSHDRNRK